MSQAAHADLLEQLAQARQQGRADDALRLSRSLRPLAGLLARNAEAGGGTKGRRTLLLRLFHLGVFDEPPLSGPGYDAWRDLREIQASLGPLSGTAACASDSADTAPLLSLIMPVYNPDPAFLEAALCSVRNQTYLGWELCIADDASTDPAVHEILHRHAGQDERIRVTFRKENGHISAASNTALAVARGAWCVLMDHDDTLSPEALACVACSARQNPDATVLFSDEDRLDSPNGSEIPDAPDSPDGSHAAATVVYTSPLFKPGFDPDLFLTCNVVSHLGVYRTDVVRRLGGFRPGLEGAQDYDLALRVLADAGEGAFVHLPHVLYHWRRHAGSTSASIQAKPYARDAALRARLDFLAATENASAQPVRGKAELSMRPNSGFVDVRFHLTGRPPLLSLVLAMGGEDAASKPDPSLLADLLSRCGYAKREVLVVLPESLTAECFSQWERRIEAVKARLVTVANATSLISCFQAGAKQARGKALGFVRLGDSPVSSDWAENVVAALWRDGIGVAGCRAVSPQGFLRHAGYAVGYATQVTETGEKGTAEVPCLCPAYAGLHIQSAGYYSQAHLLHSVLGVYASGLFCRHDFFEQNGGFTSEMGELAAADFCLRAWLEKRLRTVVVPGVDMLSAEAPAPCRVEGTMAERWADLLLKAPPFQSPNLAWTPGGWKLRPQWRPAS